MEKLGLTQPGPDKDPVVNVTTPGTVDVPTVVTDPVIDQVQVCVPKEVTPKVTGPDA